MTFWILWGLDVLIAGLFVMFFLIGLSDGSVSSFNMGLWALTLLVLGFIVGGSLALRAKGRTRLASLLLLVLAVPGVLCGLFLLTLLIANPRWN